MAIREAIEKITLILHQHEEFREPIPRLVLEAEGSQRVVWLWQDFCQSVNRHLTANRQGNGTKRFLTGRRRTAMQQMAFRSGLERICADFERCCENVTIYPHVGQYKIALQMHRLKIVPAQDRHRNQLFVATIPEYESSSVPAVRATLVGEQHQQQQEDDCTGEPHHIGRIATISQAGRSLGGYAHLPIAAAVAAIEAVPCQLEDDRGSSYHELLPMAEAELA